MVLGSSQKKPQKGIGSLALFPPSWACLDRCFLFPTPSEPPSCSATLNESRQVVNEVMPFLPELDRNVLARRILSPDAPPTVAIPTQHGWSEIWVHLEITFLKTDGVLLLFTWPRVKNSRTPSEHPIQSPLKQALKWVVNSANTPKWDPKTVLNHGHIPRGRCPPVCIHVELCTFCCASKTSNKCF